MGKSVGLGGCDRRGRGGARSLLTPAPVIVGAPRPDIVGAPPSDREHVRALRDEAAVACTEQAWAACEEKLNEARALDPGGERDARVVDERKAIAAHPR